jgi:hypothetical protein
VPERLKGIDNILKFAMTALGYLRPFAVLINSDPGDYHRGFFIGDWY